MPGHCTTGRNPHCSWFADRWHFPTDSQICSCKTPAQKAYHWPQQSQNNSPCVKSFFSVQVHRINVLFQMSDHLFSNSLLHPFQSVYKPEHSTETILLEIALKQLFRKLSTISYFLLIMETFLLSRSLISPDVILCGWLGSKHQLLNYRSLIFQQRSVELITTVYVVVFEHVFGIHDTALQWFSSYLSTRFRTVCLRALSWGLFCLSSIPHPSLM